MMQDLKNSREELKSKVKNSREIFRNSLKTMRNSRETIKKSQETMKNSEETMKTELITEVEKKVQFIEKRVHIIEETATCPKNKVKKDVHRTKVRLKINIIHQELEMRMRELMVPRPTARQNPTWIRHLIMLNKNKNLMVAQKKENLQVLLQSTVLITYPKMRKRLLIFRYRVKTWNKKIYQKLGEK